MNAEAWDGFTGFCQELRKESDVPHRDATALGDVADGSRASNSCRRLRRQAVQPQGTEAASLRDCAGVDKEQVVGIPNSG